MEFATQFTPSGYKGEVNDGKVHTVPDDAMSPAEILDRFVRDMPLPMSQQPSGTVQGDLDVDAFPMQGQEYDPLEQLQDLEAAKQGNQPQ